MTGSDLSCLIQKLYRQKDWEERIIDGTKKTDMLFQKMRTYIIHISTMPMITLLCLINLYYMDTRLISTLMDS